MPPVEPKFLFHRRFDRLARDLNHLLNNYLQEVDIEVITSALHHTSQALETGTSIDIGATQIFEGVTSIDFGSEH